MAIIRTPLDRILAGGVRSKPPIGTCKVVNIYYNPMTKKIVIEYNDVPITKE